MTGRRKVTRRLSVARNSHQAAYVWQRLKATANASQVMLTTTWAGGAACGAIAAIVTVTPLTIDLDRLIESPATREAGAQFEAVLDILEREYVERVDPREVLKESLSASLSKLDPYTEFEEKRAADELVTQYQGRYAGVGMVIGKRGKETVVVEAFEGYTFEAGLRSSDRLLSVNGKATADMSLDKVRDLLRGEPGSEVNVEFRHVWETAPRVATLIRYDVREPDLRLATLVRLEGDQKYAAYARVSLFSRETATSLRSALELLTSAADIDGIILDLRGNPGGLLEAGVQVASLFLPSGCDIATATSHDETITFRASDQPTFLDRRRLVVLVDGGTASASEIVAAAVQDNDVGIVVGERTFGKGLVQEVVDLPYGAKLKLTVGRYSTPSGRSLQEVDYFGERTKGRSERPQSRSYATSRGRPVRSGTGVTPDVLVKPSILLAPPEAFLASSGLLDTYVDKWLADKRPDLAAKLYLASTDPAVPMAGNDRQGSTLLAKRPAPPKRIFASADVLDLERFVLDAVRESNNNNDDDIFVQNALQTDEEREADSKQRQKLLDDLAGSFKARPGQVAKLADTIIRDRFFRSSANFRRLLDDDAQFEAAVALLKDQRRYDLLLSPPSSSK